MPLDFLDLVKWIGTFAFFAIAGIVAFMLVVSLIDRNPSRKTDSKKEGKQEFSNEQEKADHRNSVNDGDR